MSELKNSSVDVLIIGAGISGIGTAYHLQNNCPDKTFTLIEARSEVGGTWDLFRYPGIRSDSDMYTFGFNFKPWRSPKAISPGEDIRAYVKEAATENNIYPQILFQHKAVKSSWSSEQAMWTTEITDLTSDDSVVITSQFIFSAAGYYDYDQGYRPDFPGEKNFAGQIVHPQHWPEDLDYAGKKVVIIGSGATAVTLVPAMAKTAELVTMLQRSPTYIANVPGEDKLADWLREHLPAKLAYSISRWKKVLWTMLTFQLARRWPDKIKQWLLDGVKAELGKDFDVEKHFTPSYNPWDQRICAVPDGDFFKVIRQGKAKVVTDNIASFTEQGIKLESGEELEADIIVTATGLRMNVLQHMAFEVDDKPVDIGNSFAYKGMMLSAMPNFAFSVGYTNASWTLKSDLVGQYFCRIVNYMEDKGFTQCVPTLPIEGVAEETMIDFSSGYVLRALDDMPKQGTAKPWKLYQNYILDRISLGLESVNNSAIEYR